MKISLFDAGEGPKSFNSFGKSYWTSLPHYGLCALSSTLKQDNNEVSLIDVRQLRDYSQLEEILLKQSPDIVGLTMRTADEYFLKDIAQKIKKLSSKIKVIVGGVHVSIAWERLQKNSNYDYLVTGEGEKTFPKLVRYIETNANKETLNFISDKVIRGESVDMDNLPFNDRELYSYKECIKHPNYPGILEAPMVTMIFSRGCPFSCRFCAPSERSTDDLLFGRKLKTASVDRVIKELIYLRDRYQFKSIKFYDYTFTTKRRWVEEFCHKYTAEGFDQKFLIQTRADLIVKNEDLIKMLADVGLKVVIVGYESGSDKILKYLNKRTTAIQNLKASEILKKYKVVNVANFMLGTPEETKEDVNLTVRLAKQMKPDICSVSYYTPIEGTPLYDEVMKAGLSLVNKADELYTYAPNYERIRGIDYKYLNKATAKILTTNVAIPLFGYIAYYLYAKTKRNVALREMLVKTYILFLKLRKTLKR